MDKYQFLIRLLVTKPIKKWSKHMLSKVKHN